MVSVVKFKNSMKHYPTIPGKHYTVLAVNECTVTIPAHGSFEGCVIVCPAGEQTIVHVPTKTIILSDEKALLIPFD